MWNGIKQTNLSIIEMLDSEKCMLSLNYEALQINGLAALQRRKCVHGEPPGLEPWLSQPNDSKRYVCRYLT